MQCDTYFFRQLLLLVILYSGNTAAGTYDAQGRAIEFVIIIPSYNNASYYYANLESVIHQKTDASFEVIYINDCSTDDTGSLVESYVRNNQLEKKIKIVHNATRLGTSVENLYHAIHTCANHKIIVNLDGDDLFAHEHVLARLVQEYQDPRVWFTYGQFMWMPHQIVGFAEPFPESVMATNSFRHYKFVTTHLRTFKAGLFKRVKKEDLLHEGKFYPMAGDVAWMLPMLEMASKGHIRFIPDILYFYNTINPLCDHNKNLDYQRALTAEIYAKPTYQPLDSLNE